MNADRVKLAAECSQRNVRRACRAQEQCSPDLSFQSLNGICERRLRNTAFLSGAGEVQLGTNFEKVSNVLRLHLSVLHRAEKIVAEKEDRATPGPSR